MSYYKVRSVAFKRSIGEIYVTCADSSLRPLKYYRSEYAENIEDFAEKCKLFWVDVLSGNFQFTKSNQWHYYVKNAYAEMHLIAHNIDIFSKDLDYRTNFYNELQEYVAKTYLVPLVTKEAKRIDIDFEADFAERCQKRWDEIDKERAEKKQISIRAALISDVFPGWDTLLSKKENRIIVAKSQNYDNHGLLDNSDKTAVLLPEGSGNDWRLDCVRKYGRSSGDSGKISATCKCYHCRSIISVRRACCNGWLYKNLPETRWEGSVCRK